MLERWLHREKVRAIHRRDLEAILRELGVLEDIWSKKTHCVKCGKVVSLDDIHCILMEDSIIKFCCNDIACYKQVQSREWKPEDER